MARNKGSINVYGMNKDGNERITNGVCDRKKQTVHPASILCHTHYHQGSYKRGKVNVHIRGSRAETLREGQSWGQRLPLSFTSCLIRGGTPNGDAQVFSAAKWAHNGTNLNWPSWTAWNRTHKAPDPACSRCSLNTS